MAVQEEFGREVHAGQRPDAAISGAHARWMEMRLTIPKEYRPAVRTFSATGWTCDAQYPSDAPLGAPCQRKAPRMFPS